MVWSPGVGSSSLHVGQTSSFSLHSLQIEEVPVVALEDGVARDGQADGALQGGLYALYKRLHDTLCAIYICFPEQCSKTLASAQTICFAKLGLHFTVLIRSGMLTRKTPRVIFLSVRRLLVTVKDYIARKCLKLRTCQSRLIVAVI
jgi:hypothetical protein